MSGSEKNINGKEKKTSFYYELFDWAACVFSALICFIIVFTLLAKVITVDGNSMYPTLEGEFPNADRLIVSDLFYTPSYGDIVIVYADQLHNSQTNSAGKPIVKRVIGLPGDTIKIDFTNGIVYRNGEALDEPYTNTITTLREDFPNNTDVVIEDGKIFVLGDNRNASKDSRSNEVGQIDMRYIIGKAYFRIYPFDKLGML